MRRRWRRHRRELPCLGTTHADHFYGSVPVTRQLTEAEAAGDYEEATGQAIVERFSSSDPATMPAVLVAGHGAVHLGASPADSVHAAIALEEAAAIAVATWQIVAARPRVGGLCAAEAFLRKHGPGAYYGQQ